MAGSVAGGGRADTAERLCAKAEQVDSNDIPGSMSNDTGLPLLDLDSAKETSLTLGRMCALFHATTGLELFLFYRASRAGPWKENGFRGAIQMPHFCQLVQSTPEGRRRCTASHRNMMEEARRHPHLVCQRCHANLITFHLPVLAKGSGTACIQTVGALHERCGPERFLGLYDSVADLGLSKKQMQESAYRLAIVAASNVERVVEWLELFSSFLVEISAPTLATRQEVESEAAQSCPPHCKHRGSCCPLSGGMRPCSPPLQEQVRKHIGRHVALPAAQSNLSSGCSAALLARVAAFLDDYYYLPLSTQLMAWGLGFEPSYFAKMFKRHNSISLAKHLKRVRLSRAKKLLEGPYLSIVEISNRTGFSDASYFTRVFRRAFGMTPSQFRELTGDKP